MALSDPFIIVDPIVTIDGIDLRCNSMPASLTPEDKMVDVSTICNPDGERPGTTKWTAKIPMKLSYDDPDTGDQGSWNVLHAIRKQRKTVTLAPANAAASPGNPVVTFDAVIPSIPFFDPNDDGVTEFDLELSVIGEPVPATSVA